MYSRHRGRSQVPEIRCVCCGKLYREVSEFDDVEQAGLSLVGRCSSCGQRQPIGELWQVTRRIDLRSEHEHTNDET
jgi:DNA-directed RNA polymerase subunit N (RpoN/RPB10)